MRIERDWRRYEIYNLWERGRQRGVLEERGRRKDRRGPLLSSKQELYRIEEGDR